MSHPAKKMLFVGLVVTTFPNDRMLVKFSGKCGALVQLGPEDISLQSKSRRKKSRSNG